MITILYQHLARFHLMITRRQLFPDHHVTTTLMTGSLYFKLLVFLKGSSVHNVVVEESRKIPKQRENVTHTANNNMND